MYAEDEAIELYRRALGFMERTGDDPRARETLLRLALTHHLAFDYGAANQAFQEAFVHPAPVPRRLEPNERIVWAMPAAWDRAAAPGYSWTDPAFQVARHLFRGLVAIRRNLVVEPDLAERFTVSDDGRSYEFTFRADAVWSDGVPVTADDFAFAFDRMADEDVATVSWLDGVSAAAVGEGALEIRLREPRNDFLFALAQPPLFAWPRHVYEREGPDWHRSIPLVGNGPFTLIHRDEDRVVLMASPTWYGARGNVGEVTIELEASPAVAGDRWRRGEYDVLNDVLSLLAVDDDQTVVMRSPGTWTWHLAFNASRAPTDDARVRRALAHAVDRHGPAQAMGGTATGTGGLVPPTIPAHSHRVAPPFDPDRARALLREAGYADGRAVGEIEIACLDLWEDAASDVVAQLAGIGVRTRLLVTASDADLDAAIREGAHAFLWAWGGEYPDAGRGFLEPILDVYPSLYRDGELEQLLARAASLPDQDGRLRIYREFERIWIGEQAAILPIAYGDTGLWVRPWVTGTWVSSTEISTFADAIVTPRDRSQQD